VEKVTRFSELLDMSVAAAVTKTTFWKLAGISFTRFANVSARAVRKCARIESHAGKSKFAEREHENLGFRTWSNGKRGPLEPMKPFGSTKE